MKLDYAKERAEEIHIVADMFEQRIDKDCFQIFQVGSYLQGLGKYETINKRAQADKLWSVIDVNALREVNFFYGRSETDCLEKLTDMGDRLKGLSLDLARQFPRGVCICDDELPQYLHGLANAFSTYILQNEEKGE